MLFYKRQCTRLTVRIKLIRQLYKLGSGFGKFKKDSNHMIFYIRVRKSYFQISDFYSYCSVIYVIYNHNIINMYSQTCLKQAAKGNTKIACLRQVLA